MCRHLLCLIKVGCQPAGDRAGSFWAGKSIDYRRGEKPTFDPA